MYGFSEADRCLIDMVVYHAEDLRSPMTNACYHPDFEKKKVELTESVASKFASLEEHAKERKAKGMLFVVCCCHLFF